MSGPRFIPGHSRVLATGAYLPEDRIGSRQIMEELDAPALHGLPTNWLERNTGVRERLVAPGNLQPSDFATIAAQDALSDAELRASDIDVIVFSGVFRDFQAPATAHVVARNIGARSALVFDVANASHGFMNGVQLLDGLIGSGHARHGVVVCGETGSRCRRETIELLRATPDRDTFLRFYSGLAVGDCGAAMVLGPKTEADAGFTCFALESRSRHFAYATLGRECADNLLDLDRATVQQEEADIWQQLFPAFLHAAQWQPQDIARGIVHHAEKGMLQRVAAGLNLSTQVFLEMAGTMGDLLSANLPVGLHLLRERGQLRRGDKVLLLGGGSGIVGSVSGLVWG